jgi:spore maturation protein CgeB
MNFLLIQENGRHAANRNFRECFSLQRSLKALKQNCDVWGLGHSNYEQYPDFSNYDVIVNLENYDEDGWVPDLSEVSCKKYLWSIDAHVRGLAPYKKEFRRGNYTKILQSTLQLVDEDSVWFPNAYDDTLIKPLDVDKVYDVGFCGNVNNREFLLSELSTNFNLKKDIFVIGDEMVRAINSYKVHFNCNIGIDINYRSFETIGCKTALVTNYNQAYEELGFVHGTNCMMYNTVSELRDSINTLLEDNTLLQKVTCGGYELAKQHTYLKRAQQFLEEIV